MLNFSYQNVVTNLQQIDTADWSRQPAYNSSNNMDAYQQQQQQQQPIDYGQNEYEKRRDSRSQSRQSSRAGSRSNSRPSSRPMSRASSQQRFYDEPGEYGQQQQQQQQPRSLSRNDSQKSLTDYQTRQPDPLITTRIEESYVEPGMEVRKPSVTFKNDEFEQPQDDLQQMAEQRSPIYATQPSPQQYDDQSYYQQQPEYQPDFNQSQQNMGYNYDQQQYVPQQPQYEQPEQQQQPRFYQSESRRQSPENTYQQIQGYSDSRRQSPEQSYVEPPTPKRASPPKTPTREQSREEIDKVVQQRQQSREQIYGGRGDEGEPKALSSKQQSRDNLSEPQVKSPSPPASQNVSPTSTTAPITSLTKGPINSNAKQVAPPSPKRGPTPARNAKGGAEQKPSRNALGEATGTGRKSDSVQKQPSKVANIRGKK